jgi:hypothetical protein
MNIRTGQLGEHEERQTKICLFAGIILWFVELNVIYALPSLSCKWGWFPFQVGPLSGLQFVQMLISLVAVALMAYVTYLPYRNWREYQTDPPAQNPHMLQDTEKERQSLLAFIVMMANSFFLLFILGLFVLIFSLKPCG